MAEQQKLNRAQRRRVQKMARKARKKLPRHKWPYLRVPIDRPPATSDVMRKLQAAADKEHAKLLFKGEQICFHCRKVGLEGKDLVPVIAVAVDKDPNQDGKPVWLHPECLEKFDQIAESKESQENA